VSEPIIGEPANETPEDSAPALQVITAFTVLLHPNGKWEARPAVGQPIQAERMPLLEEMRTGAEAVAFEIGISMAAQVNTQYQLSMAQQARAQAENAAIASKLHLPR
jgi:hypothetical protein